MLSQPNYFLVDGNQADPCRLHFRRSFLQVNHKIDTTNMTVPYQLVLEAIQESSRTGTSRLSWRGFWCSACGRLSCSKHWDRLECAHCHATAGAMPTAQPPPAFKSGLFKQIHTIGQRSMMTPFKIDKEAVQGWTYHLPNNTGRIHRFWSLDPARMKQINDLFCAFQQNYVGTLLKRNPLSRHKGGGGKEFLTGQCKFESDPRFRIG